MSDHRQALEDIMRECAASRSYTRRTQVINEIAMKALGMTSGQRHDVHMRIMERVGNEPVKAAYLRRRENRSDMAQYMQREYGVVMEAAP